MKLLVQATAAIFEMRSMCLQFRTSLRERLYQVPRTGRLPALSGTQQNLIHLRRNGVNLRPNVPDLRGQSAHFTAELLHPALLNTEETLHLQALLLVVFPNLADLINCVLVDV